MSRLSKALQHVCPNAAFTKFGNFPMDMPSNCPTMRTRSNDCGFFVMSYMKFYDHNAGVITSFNQPVSDCANSFYNTVAIIVHVSYISV
jgi:competence transcription factor ComK